MRDTKSWRTRKATGRRHAARVALASMRLFLFLKDFVDPDLLPRVGVISNATHDFIRTFSAYFSITGRRVLCIGYSESELGTLVEPYSPAEIACLTNWEDHADAQLSRHRMVLGDLCGRTEFAAGEFDAVLLLSVLEHLGDPEAAFVEMRRILKPHGHVGLLFGPAWSCAYGHHIYADPADPNLNFVLWKLPAHMHLLCSEEELRDWYRKRGYPDGVGDTVLHWFYETRLINRVFYEDYVRLMHRHFQVVASEVMYNDLPRAHTDALRARFPGYSDFSTYGGKFLLRVTE
jgi:SAM-dependent methyltransferase